MIIHDHDNGAYAHSTTNLWPKNMNFTISYLIKEVPSHIWKTSIMKFQKLFDKPPVNDYFEKLLRIYILFILYIYIYILVNLIFFHTWASEDILMYRVGPRH